MRYFNQPLSINGVLSKNRLVMPPMATAKSTPQGQVSDALCTYYQLQGKSGPLGLIITEHSYIADQGKASPGQLSIAHDRDIVGLSRLVSAIHQTDTAVMAQISHAGSAGSPDNPLEDLVAPSALPHPRAEKASKRTVRALSHTEIETIVGQFADAAQRAKKAGFDGVEIHSAHGYLLNQFYSPLTNQRHDVYGSQSLENRVRFHLEVIDAIRSTVGKDYPLALRLGGCDYTPGGSSIAQSVQASILFEKAGLDLLDISGGIYGYIRCALSGPGYFRDMTGAIKEKVRIPIILTGGVKTAEDAEKLLAHHDADLIGVGRALLETPCWAAKAFATPL